MILSQHVYIFRVLYHFFSMPVTVLWSIREKMSHSPLWLICQPTVPSPSNIPIWKSKKTQRHFKYHFREAFLSSPRQNEAFWPLCRQRTNHRAFSIICWWIVFYPRPYCRTVLVFNESVGGHSKSISQLIFHFSKACKQLTTTTIFSSWTCPNYYFKK